MNSVQRLGALRSCGRSLHVQPWIKIYRLIEKQLPSPCSSAHMTQNPCKLQLFLTVCVSNYKLSRKAGFDNVASIVFKSHIDTYITAVVDTLIVA